MSATCEWCHQEMVEMATCKGNLTVEFPDTMRLPALPYEGNSACHDCNISPGGYHHPGCDQERCPRCEGQLISCGCLDSGGEEYE